MKERIYVCHTFYHVYVTFLKELKLREQCEEAGKSSGGATLVLSNMSIDFENLKSRVESTGIFEAVVEFDEKAETYFPELAEYKKDTGNFVKNLLQRMKFTRRYAELEAPYIPVNFREYKDIYVFCDSDPIGYYLNQNRIYYHAVEDGLNCIKNFDAARYDNRGHFGLKAFLSMKMNLIFVQNGYGKYCLDMEVNDISALQYPCPRYIEEPRQALVDRLTEEDKEIILKAFIRDIDTLTRQIEESSKSGDKILILTEPLCTLDVREQIFRDVIDEYCKDAVAIIKPHPRDELDYKNVFKDQIVIEGKFPMEVLNFIPEMKFDKVISVFTVPGSIQFSGEVIFLGQDFMDKYEAPEIHRGNDYI